jgi:hypothetical protein
MGASTSLIRTDEAATRSDSCEMDRGQSDATARLIHGTASAVSNVTKNSSR